MLILVGERIGHKTPYSQHKITTWMVNGKSPAVIFVKDADALLVSHHEHVRWAPEVINKDG